MPFSFDDTRELAVDPGLPAHEEIFFGAARPDRSPALPAKDCAPIAAPRTGPIAD